MNTKKPPISAKPATPGGADPIRTPQPALRVPKLRSKRAQRKAAARAKRLALLSTVKKADIELPTDDSLERIMLDPGFALQLLEYNTLNRPISDGHVHRIARQILEGKWKFNGDTIKISENQEVLDGQHRLWAIVEAGVAVETVVVYGIKRDAFATIDTVRRLRSGGDTVALSGVRVYRNVVASALSWLLRWQKGSIEDWRSPDNRIENSDVEKALESHPGMIRAAEMANKVRLIANPSVIAFAYYVMHNQNSEIAEEFIKVLIDPTATSLNHPFFKLRAYFTGEKGKVKAPKDPVMSLALIFKAANAVKEGRNLSILRWNNQGMHPESFPALKLG